MRAADALIAALRGGGVDTVFGMPGGATLPLYDALLDSGIRHVLMRHEAAAGHAAEGYARATGRPGVAFATSGPGATNLVTAIAWAASSGRSTAIECLTIGAVMPITSASWKAFVPRSAVLTCPVTNTVGTESMAASAIGVTRFVAPGPLVAKATPGRPVARA